MITREQAKRCVGKGWHGLIDEFYDTYPEAEMQQVKEKFGSLCLYHWETSAKSLDLELELRNRSSRMCEECGKPCESREIRHWVWTLCDEHAKLQEDKKKI